jgi:hypothetical protein
MLYLGLDTRTIVEPALTSAVTSSPSQFAERTSLCQVILRPTIGPAEWIALPRTSK